MDNTNLINQYLLSGDSQSRINFLKTHLANGEFLPLDLVEDLMYLDLQKEEKVLLIKALNNSSNLEFENFLLSNIINWHQDIGVCAIKEWVSRSYKFLWFKLFDIILSSYSTQRIKFTILNFIPQIKILPLLKIFLKINDLEEYSSAFHALLLHQAITYNLEHNILKDIAKKYIDTLLHDKNYEDYKAIPDSLFYLAKFDENYLLNLNVTNNIPKNWLNFILTINQTLFQKELLLQNFKNFLIKSSDNLKNLNMHLLPAYLKHLLDEELIYKLIKTFVSQNKNIDWNILEGINYSSLTKALLMCEDGQEFISAYNLIHDFLLLPYDQRLLEKIHHNFNSSENFIQQTLDPRICLQLFSNNMSSHDKDIYDMVLQNHINIMQLLERSDFDTLSKESIYNNSLFEKKYKDLQSKKTQNIFTSRKAFFNAAFKNIFSADINIFDEQDRYWYELYNIIKSIQEKQNLNDDILDNLSSLARSMPLIYKLCFLYVLKFFYNSNKAFLKILDYIRSDDPVVISYVVYALAGIGTPRSLQELIFLITKPNTPIDLKFEIINILKGCNLSQVQSELQSVMHDLQPSYNLTDPVYEIKENLKSLVMPVLQQNLDVKEKVYDTSYTSEIEKHIELFLQNHIPYYSELSSDIKRALRTAKFFEYQIFKLPKIKSNLDLTPVVEMQYKALELFFRESFENFCKTIIDHGIIQRKLDFLGYARLIESKMNEFENYIASLPIIKDIPFFSKFKLRKMLISLSQHTLKKRFTLDSIKAFSIFILCFARKKCLYNLKNIINIPSISDEELFEWCKQVHLFQDMRNRAAHEGFVLENINKVEQIWNSTAQIIKTTMLIKSTISSSYINH